MTAHNISTRRIRRVAEAHFCNPKSLKTWADRYGYAPTSERWRACFGDYALGSTVGTGLTPEAAIEDLLDQMEG